MRNLTRAAVALVGLGTTASVLTPAAASAPLPNRTLDAATRAAIQAVQNPHVSWRRCAPGLQCGELVVPLDYSDMTKGTVRLPISRRPADDSRRRIGSLFTNPGGPGGAATQTVPDFASFVGGTVRARFDIVGLAPRGVEAVDAEDLAICTGKVGDDVSPDNMPMAFPTNAKERAAWLEMDRRVNAACATNTPRILAHMTTADDARDMDLARRALGDKKISYYGISYGSYLGETYAALFPKNIRALAVDGVLDPVAWATGRGRNGSQVPVTERIGSGQGSYDAMQAVISECERVGTASCPEAGTFRSDWTSLTKMLQAGPVNVQGMSITYDFLIAVVQSALYSPDQIALLPSEIHDLNVQVQLLAVLQQSQSQMRAAGLKPAKASMTAAQRKARITTAQRKAATSVANLQEMARKALKSRAVRDDTATAKQVPAPRLGTSTLAATDSPSATPTATSTATATSTPTSDPSASSTPSSDPSSTDTPSSDPSATADPTDPQYPATFFVGFQGVLCSDSLNSHQTSTWVTADRRVAATYPGFGQTWLWSSSICANWPVETADAYRGPFTATTSAPVLIFGNEHDPATPYSGAVAYHKLQKTSRLVTLKNGYGHGAVDISTCVDKIRTNYLVSGKVPAKDTSCAADHPLFTRLG